MVTIGVVSDTHIPERVPLSALQPVVDALEAHHVDAILHAGRY